MKRTLDRLNEAARKSAEQWVIECPKCHHAAPALERGIVRIGAASKGKRVLARCSACNKLTFAKLSKDPERAHELRIAAYDQEIESLEHELDQPR